MIKIAAFSDSHIDYTTPAMRKDDYLQSILAEFEYMLSYCENEGIEYLLCSGDLFHRAEQSGTVQRLVTLLLKKYQSVHLISTLGQHDVNGHNTSGYLTKSIGILEANDLVTVLTHGQELKLYDKVVVRGYAFNEPETIDFLKGVDGSLDDEKIQIAIVHASVGKKGDVTYGNEIENQNIKSADISIFGDIHPGWGVHEFPNGCNAFNLGSFGRRNIEDHGRPQMFLVLEIKEDASEWGYSFVTVPTPPEDDVWFTVEEEAAAKDISEEFRAEWSKAKLFRDETPTQMAKRIGELFEHTQDEILLVIQNLPEEALA